LLAAGELGQLLFDMCDLAKAAPLLTQAVEGLAALKLRASGMRQRLTELQGLVEDNARCVTNPSAAAQHQVQRQCKLRRQRLALEARLPSVAATVVGVQSHAELNGTEVKILRYLREKGRYVVQLPPNVFLPSDAEVSIRREEHGVSRYPMQLPLDSDGKTEAVVMGLEREKPEISGAAVTIRRFQNTNGRYTAADAGSQERIHLQPTNLQLAEGAAVVVTGLAGTPQLNGHKGKVECWIDDEKGRFKVYHCSQEGRYAVRLEGKARQTVNLKPENCRADVLTL